MSSAFHHLGVEEELRQRLNFRYNGVTYRYVGLPFGLRSAPRLFCAAIKATLNAVRREWDCIVSNYMDDIIIMYHDKKVLTTWAEEIVQFIEWLG